MEIRGICRLGKSDGFREGILCVEQGWGLQARLPGKQHRREHSINVFKPHSSETP